MTLEANSALREHYEDAFTRAREAANAPIKLVDMTKGFHGAHNWIFIEHEEPSNLGVRYVRHRLWTDAATCEGQLDLVLDPMPKVLPEVPTHFLVQPYGNKGTGIVVARKLAELRFDASPVDINIAVAQVVSFSVEIFQWAQDHKLTSKGAKL